MDKTRKPEDIKGKPGDKQGKPWDTKGKPGDKLRESVMLLQANQEKLARMLGSINAMFLMCFRLSKLHEAGKMSHADASMVKAWTTLRGGLPPSCIAC